MLIIAKKIQLSKIVFCCLLKNTTEGGKERLCARDELSSIPGNKQCADCGAEGFFSYLNFLILFNLVNHRFADFLSAEILVQIVL